MLPFSLIVIGQTYIPSGLASILNATTPLFTVVVMAAAGEEKLQARRIAGVIAGLIGVAILHGGDGLGFRKRAGHRHPALSWRRLQLRAVGAGGATAACQTRRRSARRRSRLLASAAMMTAVAGVVDRPWQLPMPELTTWLAVIGLAALSTALAYIVFFQILRRSGATNVMLVTLLIPVTAILLGYLVLGEKISPREIVGRAGDRQRAAVDRRAGARNVSTPAGRRLAQGVYSLSTMSDCSPTAA